jgi:hypothetical protein
MDTALISDLFRGLVIWSGQGVLMWPIQVLHTGLAVIDPVIESPALIEIHYTVAQALTRWGILVGSATAASVWLFPRLLVKR